jgi:Spinocerebellar ataxia type 10 protein domain
MLVPNLQSEVCALGGVELVLAQCQLDRHSPLAREWALWGVRNLCEGNAQAQVRRAGHEAGPVGPLEDWVPVCCREYETKLFPARSLLLHWQCRLQEAIRQLQLCTTVDNEELKRMGVRMELDEHSGKLRVIKRESDATSAAAR